MLLQRETLKGIAAGRVTLAFRRWKKRAAKPGGRQRTSIGIVVIDAVDALEAAQITAGDARAAGYPNREALLADLDRYGAGPIHRIRLHLGGVDPRVALASKRPDADEMDLIAKKLARLDGASAAGAWTVPVLELIERYPARRAPDLAQLMRLESAPFKRNVRKLKELGLTISLEVGYRLSPRGETVIAWLRKTGRNRTKRRSPG